MSGQTLKPHPEPTQDGRRQASEGAGENDPWPSLREAAERCEGLMGEALISLAQAAARVPSFRPGRKTHVATMHRWATTGCHGVILETVRLGGRRVTSIEALARFSAALTAQANGGAPTSPDAPTLAQRNRAAEAASRELDALGV